MHELSIVMSIIDIASDEAAKARVSKFSEIELEIGMLSGIEMNAFDFAWNEAVKSTILDGVERIIRRPTGTANCMECDTHFELSTLYDQCPVCHSPFIHIMQGKELRVKSLTTV